MSDIERWTPDYDQWKTTEPQPHDESNGPEYDPFEDPDWGKRKEQRKMTEEYWQERCQFWCARYLELAQAARPLLVAASRVDDYAELQREVALVETLLRRGAYGRPND